MRMNIRKRTVKAVIQSHLPFQKIILFQGPGDGNTRIDMQGNAQGVELLPEHTLLHPGAW
jgi:hypothetical protein